MGGVHSPNPATAARAGGMPRTGGVGWASRQCPMPDTGHRGQERGAVEATIRRYRGTGLADLLESRRDDVEALMSGVSGLHGYFLVRTDEGCASITVCDDAAGIEESTRLAREWISENATGDAMVTPEVIGGEVIVHLGATTRA